MRIKDQRHENLRDQRHENLRDQINENLDQINAVFTIHFKHQKEILYMTLLIDKNVIYNDEQNMMYVFLLQIFTYLNETQLYYLYSIDLKYINEYDTPQFIKERNGYFQFNPFKQQFIDNQEDQVRQISSVQCVSVT
jgi:hypothetical protein